MQKQLGLSGIVVLGLLFHAAASPVRAQVNTPWGYPRPVVSPYINLFRGGVNPAINYYGIVRPEVDFRRSIGGLQQQLIAQQQAAAAPEEYGVLPATGHLPTFRNYAHYFADRTGQSTAIAPRPPGGAVPRPAPTPAPPVRGR
jgi:hypothetical protein